MDIQSIQIYKYCHNITNIINQIVDKVQIIIKQNMDLIKQQPPIFLQQPISQPQLTQQQIQNDIQSTKTLLKSLTHSTSQTNKKIQNLLEHTQMHHQTNKIKDNTPTYYAYKNLIMNQYLITLRFYELFRLNGVTMESGVGLELYQKLFYLKSILVKLGTIDKKLQYQRDRLLAQLNKKTSKVKKTNENNKEYRDIDRLADSQKQLQQQQQDQQQQDQQQQEQSQQEQSQQKSDNQLMYRPNINNLLKKNQTPKQQNSKNKSQPQKYIAPKLASALPQNQKHKQKLQRQKQRRKAMLLRKFRTDIQGEDDEHNNQEIGLQSNLDNSYKKKYQEKIRFEQDNFVRLPETKKQKQWKKRIMKNQFKGNQLLDQLKEVQLVRQLVEDQTSKKYNQRPRKQTSNKINKLGKKKRKVQ